MIPIYTNKLYRIMVTLELLIDIVVKQLKL